MSTLEVVREMLCQATETSPGDVLKSAQDEVERLSHLLQNAKNVLQRNGARKKLAELEPLMPAVEIEVRLTELEKSVDQGKSAAQRAAARVQAQKLAAQIAELGDGEEKEFFQQWLADLNPSLASVSPGVPTSSPPPLPLPPSAAVTAAPSAPAPDPAEEIQTALVPLEARARTRPIVDSTGLARDLKALAERSEKLPSGETRRELNVRISAVTTAIKADEDYRALGEAIGALEQAAHGAETDTATALAEHHQLDSRVKALGATPEGEVFKQKLNGVQASLAAREEVTEIERALQRWSSRIQKDPTDELIETGLGALAERINRLTDAAARVGFSSRVDSLRKTLTHRRQEDKIAKTLEEIRRKCHAPEASLLSLRSSLNEAANQVQGWPPSQMRDDFEQRVLQCRDLIATTEQKAVQQPLQPAVILQLEPLKGRSAPAARPVIFVARDRFSIGRKPENEPPRADLLTPSTELRISRIHVTFFARQRQIQVVAGEEGKPSTNPATVDETPLSGTPVAMSFDEERRIDLTGVFILRAKHLPSSTPFGPPFEEGEMNGQFNNTTVLVPPIAGALRIRPQGEDRLPASAVWLFTDATVGTHPNCAVTLPQSGLAPEQVRIHFWRKSFWIEVLRSSSQVQLAGKVLQPGASQPLIAGQELRLGNFLYKVQLS